MPNRIKDFPGLDGLKVIHIGLSAYLTWLGIALAMPWDTFSTGHSWDLFSQIMPENSWAIAFFSASIVGWIGVDTSHRWVKTFSILFLASTHAIIALLYLLSNPAGTGSGLFVLIACQGYYLAFRNTRRTTWNGG